MPPTMEIGALGWLVVAMFILLTLALTALNVVVLWRKVTARPAKGSEWVTGADMAVMRTEFKSDLASVEKRLSDEIKRVEVEAKDRDKYIHEFVHKVNGELQVVVNQLAVIPGKTREQIDKALLPIARKLDNARLHIVAIAAQQGLREIPEPVEDVDRRGGPGTDSDDKE